MLVKIALLAQSRQPAAVTQILVIEDDRAIRDLFRDVLRDEGYELVFVDGLEHVAADATPDLVITDLAGIHGYDPRLARALVGRLRQRFPETPIVVCTAHDQAAAETDRLGAAAVLSKPFPIEALVETVARLAAE
jgi:CheY-like chemotaxis protein